MTIEKMIDELKKLKDLVGANEEVPVVATFGENDFIVPEYAVAGDFTYQDGEHYKCALIGSVGGEEFTEVGTPHYKWKPRENAI